MEVNLCCRSFGEGVKPWQVSTPHAHHVGTWASLRRVVGPGGTGRGCGPLPLPLGRLPGCRLADSQLWKSGRPIGSVWQTCVRVGGLSQRTRAGSCLAQPAGRVRFAQGLCLAAFTLLLRQQGVCVSPASPPPPATLELCKRPVPHQNSRSLNLPFCLNAPAVRAPAGGGLSFLGLPLLSGTEGCQAVLLGLCPALGPPVLQRALRFQ